MATAQRLTPPSNRWRDMSLRRNTLRVLSRVNGAP